MQFVNSAQEEFYKEAMYPVKYGRLKHQISCWWPRFFSLQVPICAPADIIHFILYIFKDKNLNEK
jgi:hypothetical protein